MTQLTIEEAREKCATGVMGLFQATKEIRVENGWSNVLTGTWLVGHRDNPKAATKLENWRPDLNLQQAEELKARLTELGHDYTYNCFGRSYEFAIYGLGNKSMLLIADEESTISEGTALVLAAAEIGKESQ